MRMLGFCYVYVFDMHELMHTLHQKLKVTNGGFIYKCSYDVLECFT